MTDPKQPATTTPRPFDDLDGAGGESAAVVRRRVARRVVLRVSYDGSEFSGWARQPQARTVAGELDGAIELMDPRATAVRGASRTDAGVHAREQLCVFDTARVIEPRGWALGLSQNLPDSVAVTGVAVVTPEFDLYAAVRRKTYRYRFRTASLRDPFRDRYRWRTPEALEPRRMADEAQDLVGTHDFRAFRSAADQRDDCTRTIEVATLVQDAPDGNELTLEIRGDRFLHNMVRIIAGTLWDVGRGRLLPGAIGRAIASGRRDDLGMTAPAHGLCLERIELHAPLPFWPDA